MEIKLFNSLTDKLEVFVPLKAGEVSIYVCGPTVYNDAHIGNMRPVVVFDVLRRFFEYLDYKVTFVSNFTDVDDKIINRAIAEHVSEIDLSQNYIAEFKKVVSAINSLAPTYAPKVTDHIPEIITYIEELIDKGAAYVVDGDVYFRVSAVQKYGQLSNINVEDLISGARVEENSKKESPLDFVLWKRTEVGVNWNSRWSKGRPGWHTECCVMINSIFPGGRIDIHGGGFDLKFPHHENEIAQSRAHNNNAIATYWMHNGFINFGDEKMSKSLGNVVLAKDAIAQYGAQVIRLVLLGTYYRSPVNLNAEVLSSAQSEYEKIQNSVSQLAVALQLAEIPLVALKKPDISSFLTYLADDLNTPNAITEIFAIIKKANAALRQRPVDYNLVSSLFSQTEAMLSILGLDVTYPHLSKEDKKTYAEYLKYKAEKNFIESDRLRHILMAKHIL